MSKVRRSHFLLGAHGLAVLRRWPRGEDATGPHVKRLLSFTEELEGHALNAQIEQDELDVSSGYALWSDTYDGPNNALISVEEPAVLGILQGLRGGTALDAACGTGRYALYLRERGFNVVAADGSAAMISKARTKVPSARFALADLSSLPFKSGSFDVATCALALGHCPNLRAPVAELSRVLRPDGHLVVSEFHPANEILGGGTFFRSGDGRRNIIKNYWHGVADYVTAFVKAELKIEACVERAWTEREVLMMNTAKIAPEAIIGAFVGVPLALVWCLRRSRV